ncbi:MAG TPA: UDP-N-acetylmuramate--L-alanine ligase [Fervidobacterium sp.]|nr:UDP-N-acetylmuramate--L-alanine ligase [Fervidobacterium sp.]HOM73576.1 UDP-N-acetylmuramate--L-alanine ligase [Fervidobacterium sp.]HPP17470.1 UDP-N-acetylmuramate--L-alanine ligase [Fervidobacterium sp.]
MIFEDTSQNSFQDSHSEAEKIHFIGIGGIGMSAQAMYEHFHGKRVTGSDPYSSERAIYLENIGIKVFRTHDESNVYSVDEVIITPAISKDNPEYVYAKNNNMRMTMRIEHFRSIVEKYKGLAVTGTDGKSTTTAMLANSLINLNQDPYVFLGALHTKLEYGNYRSGKDIVVYELDESQPGFELFKPECLIITNVREDHLENYNSLDHYYDSFITLMNNTSFVVTFEDEKKFKGDATFGVYSGNFRLVERKQEGFLQTVDIYTPWGEKKFILPVPGYHNALNALSVITLLSSIGYNIDDVLNSFYDFRLPGRRFNISYDDPERKLTIIDDYAHTADELEVLLKTAKEVYSDRKVILIFQPHRYTRLKREEEKFKKVLQIADEIYVTEVYGAFETKNGVSAKKIVEDIQGSIFVQDLNELKNIKYDDNCVYLFVGAGDIYNISQSIVNEFKKVVSSVQSL